MRVEVRFAFALWLVPLVLVGCAPTPPKITERAAWKGHAREVVSIAIAPDGKTLATRGTDALKVWDLAGGQEAHSFPSDGSDFASVAFAPDGLAVAANRAEVGVEAWDLASGQSRVYAGSYGLKPGGYSCYSVSSGWGVAYSPDGKTLAGGGSHGGEDGFLTLWDVAGGGKAELASAGGPIATVSYAPDGKTFASGSLHGPVVLWDSATRRERRRIEANRSYLAPIVFSSDGRVVASSNEARWIKLWDPSTGAEVATLKGHLKAVLSIAFTPDGKCLVSGDSSGVLFFWDLERRRVLTRVESDRGKIWGLAFSPDGRTLYSTGEDKLIHVWDIAWAEPR